MFVTLIVACKKIFVAVTAKIMYINLPRTVLKTGHCLSVTTSLKFGRFYLLEYTMENSRIVTIQLDNQWVGKIIFILSTCTPCQLKYAGIQVNECAATLSYNCLITASERRQSVFPLHRVLITLKTWKTFSVVQSCMNRLLPLLLVILPSSLMLAWDQPSK